MCSATALIRRAKNEIGRCLLIGTAAEHHLEDGSDVHEFLQARWFANIPARPEPNCLLSILSCIGRAQNHDRRLSATHALTYAFQHFTACLLREIQIEDYEVGTFHALCIQKPDKLYRAFAIGQNNKLAFDPVLFQGCADQLCVRTIVLDKKNGSEFSA